MSQDGCSLFESGAYYDRRTRTKYIARRMAAVGDTPEFTGSVWESRHVYNGCHLSAAFSHTARWVELVDCNSCRQIMELPLVRKRKGDSKLRLPHYRRWLDGPEGREWVLTTEGQEWIAREHARAIRQNQVWERQRPLVKRESEWADRNCKCGICKENRALRARSRDRRVVELRKRIERDSAKGRNVENTIAALKELDGWDVRVGGGPGGGAWR